MNKGSNTGGIWADGRGRLTVGLLLTISLTAFESLAVTTVLPRVVSDLGGVGAIGWYGWVFSSFMLANLVGIPVAGRVADASGAVRPFFAGAALFAVGLTIAGLAPSMAVVVVGRVAQGFGAGAISSVAYVAVARGYPAELQPRMLAMLASAWVVPGLIGPAAAAGVTAQFGWRAVFLGLVPLTAVAAGLAAGGLGRVAPTTSAIPEQGRVRSAIQLAIGAGLVLAGAELPAPTKAVPCVLLGGAIALPALRRLLPEGTLSARPGVPAALATHALLSFAFFGAEAYLPLSLSLERGQSTTVTGATLTAGTLAWTAGAWIQARVTTRRRRRRLVQVGLGLTAVGIVGAASVLLASTPVAVAAAGWAITGLGIGLAYSTLTLVVLEESPAGHEGAASTALHLASLLGVAFGTGLGSAVLVSVTAAGRSRAVGIGIIDSTMLGAALLGLVVAGRLPQRSAD
jgi:MFS family permease